MLFAMLFVLSALKIEIQYYRLPK